MAGGPGWAQPGRPARSRVGETPRAPQGRRGAAGPSAEPGEPPRPRLAPAQPAAREAPPAGRTEPPRGFPAGYPQPPGEARLHAKRGKRKESGALGEASDTDPSSCPDRGGGEAAIALGVPRADAGVSPAAGREAGPARRRSCERPRRGLKKKMLLNKETLFGARGRDKQGPVLGRGDLPGTEAGTAEGDLRSGTRKRAGGGSQRAPGGPRDQGAEKVAARSRGRAVTWTGSLGLRRARSSVRLRSAARWERPSAGVGWFWGRESCRHQALPSAAGPLLFRRKG